MMPCRILVTNDDGLLAAGLVALVGATACGRDCDVVVAAPSGDMSSTGTALGTVWSTGVEVSLTGRDWPWPAVSATYEVAAYPSAIVTLAAMGAFGPPPDLVLVGVNHGANVGRGLLHSSTVGAALTAAAYRMPAIAFSAAGVVVDWLAWEPYLARLVAATEGWPAGAVLNVNLPERPSAVPRVAMWCRVAEADAVGSLTRTASGGQRLIVGLSADALPEIPPADTDAGALARGRMALTWLTLPYAGPPNPARPNLLAGVDTPLAFAAPTGLR